LPVTVTTIVLSLGSFFWPFNLINPAMPAALEGSTNTPSFAATNRYALKISLSVTESIKP
jgi:hypothetical protein